MFTLAHLSDPHLAPLPRPRLRELMNKRITGYINWRRNRRLIHDRAVLDSLIADLKAQNPDHIALTGDIANIALEAEFAPGRAWLESLGPPDLVSFVPGNHDVYVAQALPFAARDWGDYMRGDNGIQNFPYLRRRGDLALIGISTALPTGPGMATGLVGEAQAAAVAALLRETKREDRFRVVLIHHPPISAAPRHKRLVDAALLRQTIAAEGAELLLHGHDHMAMLNWLDGPSGTRVAAVGVPSASAAPGKAKDAAAYNLYRIDGEPGAWTCVMHTRGITADAKIVERYRIRLV